MVLAAYLTTALVVGAVGAFHLQRDQHLPGPRVMFSMAMWMAAPGRADPDFRRRSARPQHPGASARQGDGDGRSLQESPDGAPLLLFGLPDQAAGRVKYVIEVPKLSSLILKHSLDAPLAGLSHRAARKLAARADHLLVIQDHGRNGIADDGARPSQPLGALARHSPPIPIAAYFRHGDGPGWLHCRAGGLDHHGDRAPAVHGVRAITNG